MYFKYLGRPISIYFFFSFWSIVLIHSMKIERRRPGEKKMCISRTLWSPSEDESNYIRTNYNIHRKKWIKIVTTRSLNDVVNDFERYANVSWIRKWSFSKKWIIISVSLVENLDVCKLLTLVVVNVIPRASTDCFVYNTVKEKLL